MPARRKFLWSAISLCAAAALIAAAAVGCKRTPLENAPRSASFQKTKQPSLVEIDSAVVTEKTELFASPNADAAIVKTLDHGEPLIVLARSDQRFMRDTFNDPTAIEYHVIEDDPIGQGSWWYKVEDRDGAGGWVFGDRVAINRQSRFYYYEYLPPLPNGGIIRKDLDNDGSMEQIWFAVNDSAYLGSIGVEPAPTEFLVASSASMRRQAFTSVAGHNEFRSGNDILRMGFRDLTGDGAAEVIVETIGYTPEVGYDYLSVRVFRYAEGSLSDVFSELLFFSFMAGVGRFGAGTMNLSSHGINVRRVEWMGDGNPGPPMMLSRTYRWSDRDQKFIPNREASITLIRARAGRDGSQLCKDPPNWIEPDKCENAGMLPAGSEVIIGNFDGALGEWVLVQDLQGMSGWARSKQLVFDEDFLAAACASDWKSACKHGLVQW